MEKLSLSLLLLIGSIAPLFGQDSLCVFNAQGTVYFQTPTTKVALHKGDYITNAGRINVNPRSSIITIDSKGILYYINQAGNHHYNHLSDFRKNQSSFTTRYFKYIWQELKGNSASSTVIAGVFRGEFPMLYPRDSAVIGGKQVHFSWNTNSNGTLNYFFLRNKETQEILKISTDGTRFSLQTDQAIFGKGQQFEWTISYNAFPNLNNLRFYQFELIDRTTYLKRRENYGEFIADLNSLQLSTVEIDVILCQEFGLCH